MKKVFRNKERNRRASAATHVPSARDRWGVSLRAVVRHFERLSSRRALLAAAIPLRCAPFDGASFAFAPLRSGQASPFGNV